MQNSVYAVISPEGCAAILWSDGSKGAQAAEALKLTAADVDSLKTVIDAIVPEPLGGAHQDHQAAAATLKDYLLKHLSELEDYSPEGLIEQRYQRFRAMSEVEEPKNS
jgi:acetyl-CoA carboxylase carboxyl transferase subunit alpha